MYFDPSAYVSDTDRVDYAIRPISRLKNRPPWQQQTYSKDVMTPHIVVLLCDYSLGMHATLGLRTYSGRSSVVVLELIRRGLRIVITFLRDQQGSGHGAKLGAKPTNRETFIL